MPVTKSTIRRLHSAATVDDRIVVNFQASYATALPRDAESVVVSAHMSREEACALRDVLTEHLTETPDTADEPVEALA